MKTDVTTFPTIYLQICFYSVFVVSQRQKKESSFSEIGGLVTKDISAHYGFMIKRYPISHFGALLLPLRLTPKTTSTILLAGKSKG